MPLARTLGASSRGEGNVMAECSGDEAKGGTVGGIPSPIGSLFFGVEPIVEPRPAKRLFVVV